MSVLVSNEVDVLWLPLQGEQRFVIANLQFRFWKKMTTRLDEHLVQWARSDGADLDLHSASLGVALATDALRSKVSQAQLDLMVLQRRARQM